MQLWPYLPVRVLGLTREKAYALSMSRLWSRRRGGGAEHLGVRDGNATFQIIHWLDNNKSWVEISLVDQSKKAIYSLSEGSGKGRHPS